MSTQLTSEQKLDQIIRVQDILLGRISAVESYVVAFEEVFGCIIAGLSNGKMSQAEAAENVHRLVEAAAKKVAQKTENNVRKIYGQE